MIENDTVDHQRNGGDYRFARGFRFYAGHHGADVYNSVADGHLPVTNFRNPVSRVSSLYRYFRTVPVSARDLQQPRFHAVRFARERSFEEFVLTEDPRIRVYTENQHARQLSNSPWCYQAAIDMAAAVTLIDSMPCFYVCEDEARSLAWFGEQFGITHIPHENVTAPTDAFTVSERIAQAILAMNECDLALYEYARARLRALQGRWTDDRLKVAA